MGGPQAHGNSQPACWCNTTTRDAQAGTSPDAVNPTLCSGPPKSPKPGLWLSCHPPENIRLTGIIEVRLSRSDLILNDLEKVKYLKHLVVAADEIGPHSVTTIPPRLSES